MIESFLSIDDGTLFVSHNRILAGRTTLLFVHGLGDSGLAFRDVFDDPRFDDFNLIVPDLSGYGRSSASTDYSFQSHTHRLFQVLQYFGHPDPTTEKDHILIGHSMGGDITTFMCAADTGDRITSYVNIEGDVTHFDLFISTRAVEQYKIGGFEGFNRWLSQDFMPHMVYETWGRRFPGCRSYYASLRYCRPEAFLANALELVERNTKLSDGPTKSEVGRLFTSLKIPKVYCYGTESLSNESLSYLRTSGVETKVFQGASHWPMLDRPGQFYSFLYNWVRSTG